MKQELWECIKTTPIQPVTKATVTTPELKKGFTYRQTWLQDQYIVTVVKCS